MRGSCRLPERATGRYTRFVKTCRPRPSSSCLFSWTKFRPSFLRTGHDWQTLQCLRVVPVPGAGLSHIRARCIGKPEVGGRAALTHIFTTFGIREVAMKIEFYEP